MLDNYHRLAYIHNTLADEVLGMMEEHIAELYERQYLYQNRDYWLSQWFENDYDVASVSWVRNMKNMDDGYANSLFISRFYNYFVNRQDRQDEQNYPYGLPSIEGDNYFKLEVGIDWLAKQAQSSPELFFRMSISFPHMPPIILMLIFIKCLRGMDISR